MYVLIKGRDLSACSRLLEALTKSGLLSGDAVWEDLPDKVILRISASDQNWRNFQNCQFPVFDGGQ